MTAWFAELSQRLDFGVLLQDADGALRLVNPWAAELLGRDADRLAADWPALATAIEAQAGSGVWDRGTATEVTLPNGDGVEHRLRLEVVPVEDEDRLGQLLLLRDCRQLDAAERDLWSANQMRSLSRLYRSMAHELRAPLNSIVIHLELLADAVAAAPGGVPGGAPSGATVDAAAGGRSAAGRAGRYVGVLQEEMKRLNRLLLAFLSQSAPPSDAVRDFDLSEQCAEIVTLVGPQATRQRSELGFRVADGGVPHPVIARGNADHVRQALLSLVVNALEAVAGRNGARVEIEAGERDGEAYVAVTDNGPGIDPEIAGRIFDMHFTRKETGSGVGLAVARSIAERQGGRLSASDAPRGGARFELVLPAGPPTGAAEA